MSVRYWVLISDDMLYGDLDAMLPDGLRMVAGIPAANEPVPGPYGTLPDGLPYAHWVLFEDDGAPPELDDRKVELVFRRGENGLPEIMDRRLAE